MSTRRLSSRLPGGSSHPSARRAAGQARGLTLVEAVVSVGIVSLMLVAALNTVGAARVAEAKASDRGRALLLAQGLMGEILQQAYADADYGPSGFGLGATEVTGTRRQFDDVDDYDGWQASPPQLKDGTPIAWAGEYAEAVSVCWVNAADLVTASGSATGVKRITVTVSRLDVPLVTLTAHRTATWLSPADLQGVRP